VSRKVTLTERERQVLFWMQKGFSNKMIAQEIGVTVATIKVHSKSLYRKIGVENRTQAAHWAHLNPQQCLAAEINDEVVVLPPDKPLPSAGRPSLRSIERALALLPPVLIGGEKPHAPDTLWVMNVATELDRLDTERELNSVVA